MNVVIVGGGAAGLSAALAVRQAGASCVVLEARRRGQASPRGAHVHRLSSGAAQALEALEALSPGAPSPGVITLGGLERDLARAAEAAGVDLRFHAAALDVVAERARWRVRGGGGGVVHADLLIDATGGRRAVLSLLEAVLPDVFMDDLGGAEAFVSWTGRARGASGVIAWNDPGRGLDGLIQIGPAGRAALTCRYSARRPPPSLDDVMHAVCDVAGSELAGRLGGMNFSGRGVRYTAPGVQRIALEETDLAGAPPLALVGDALLLAPPRFGEGLQRAFEQALTVRAALLAGDQRGLGARLARDARRFWAGDGLAAACRTVTASPLAIAPEGDGPRTAAAAWSSGRAPPP